MAHTPLVAEEDQASLLAGAEEVMQTALIEKRAFKMTVVAILVFAAALVAVFVLRPPGTLQAASTKDGIELSSSAMAIAAAKLAMPIIKQNVFDGAIATGNFGVINGLDSRIDVWPYNSNLWVRVGASTHSIRPGHRASVAVSADAVDVYVKHHGRTCIAKISNGKGGALYIVGRDRGSMVLKDLTNRGAPIDCS